MFLANEFEIASRHISYNQILIQAEFDHIASAELESVFIMSNIDILYYLPL